jgi:hypothetical protein
MGQSRADRAGQARTATGRTLWSWTPDPVLAHWFADRPHVHGQLYEVEVPPTAMLANSTACAEAFRSESEVVINTTGLRIVEHRCSCSLGVPSGSVPLRIERETAWGQAHDAHVTRR